MSNRLSMKISKNQKTFAIFMVLLLVMQTFMMALTPLKASAAANQLDFKYNNMNIFYNGKYPDGSPSSSGAGNPNAFGPEYTMNGRTVFCIEHGIDTYPGAQYNSPKNITNYSKLSNAKKKELSLISYYGYDTNKSVKNRQFTQYMLWEAMGSKIENVRATGGVNLNGEYATFKQRVNNEINKHDTRVSFHNRTVDLRPGESITLTDTNGILKDAILRSNGGYDVSVSGNQLKITAKTNSTSGEVTFQKIPNQFVGTSLVYEDRVLQDLAEFFVADPIHMNVKVNVIQKGELEITKRGNDTSAGLQGAVYDVYDGNKKVDTVTTGSNGKVVVKDLDANKTYTIREVKAPTGYTLDSTPKTIRIQSGQKVGLTFTNEAVLGQIEVTKQDSETGNTPQGTGTFVGAEFDVKNSTGAIVDTIKITEGNKGVSKKLPLGKYTVVEKKAPNGYTINKTPQEVELTYKDQNTAVVSSSATIKNDAVKGTIEVTKQDNVTGNTPQGTGTFTGAEFEIKDSAGKVVDTLIIKDGNKVVSKQLPLGKYTVTETKAPNGYTINKTPQEVELKYKDQNTSLVSASTTIKNEAVLGTIEITKQDSETGNKAQGTGTLTGAEFEIKDSTGKVVDTLKIKEGNKVVSKQLPLGKYTVTETKAPNGYTINKTPHEVELTYKNQNTSLVSTSTTVKNEAVKGKIEIEKKDDDGKLIEGVTYDIQDANGKVVDTITTGKDGKATSKELVLGSYTVHEVKVPAPLIIDRIPIPVELKYANQTTKLVTEQVNQTNINAKGEIELHKVDYKNFKGVDGATYGLYTPTGELVQKQVTKNGGKALFTDVRVGAYYIQEIEAPKGYLLDERKYHFTISYIDDETPIILAGMEVEQRREPVIGTTASFVGLDEKEPNMTTLVDVVKYENLIAEREYTVEGFLMNKETGEPILIDGEKVTGSTTFVAESIDGEVEVEFVFDQSKLGTKSVVVFEDLYHDDLLIAVHHDINDVDQTVDIPEVKTSASFVELDKKKPNITTLVDVVKYDNLIPEKEYTVNGVLMNKETGKPVLIDGKEVTGSTTFVAEESSGSVDVKFTFDKSKLETDTVVVFEDLYQGDILFAVHHDINDEEQTVEIPEIGTEASFVELDKKDPKMTTLVDVVKYEKLNIGEEYTVSGVLMDKATGEPILIDGEKVTGETTFTPETKNGEVEVKFVFDQTKLETDTVVVFEDLHSGERLIAVHHDINDKEQTVEIPEVGTTASFVEIDKEEPDIATIVDIVKYKNLIPGKEYTVSGILMDKETGEPIEIEVDPIAEEDGEVNEEATEDEESEEAEVETTLITGETTFTPETPDGSVEVSFTFDKSKLKTKTVVVFEDLYQDERLIAVHHDINDKEQTVDIPEVKTSASFVEIDEKDTNITTIVDIVYYDGLVVGEEYEVEGHLMDKETGEPVIIDGNKIMGKTTFTPTEPTGEVEVMFVFDQSKLETDTVVVFEDLYKDGKLVAVHHDINDIEQTVEIPDVKTSASFVELDKEDPKMTTLVDVVYYENLLVGEEYTVNGVLMDKETGEPVIIDGKEVTGTTTFVPEEAEGSVEVEFVFDQTKLKTETVVVFEDLYNGERLVAVHHDINDEEQTVDIPNVGTEASFSERDTEKTNMVTLVDVVSYENLIPGKEYTVSGVLMDKDTNEPILIDGKEVTGSTTFEAKKPYGKVEVEFTFDQSKLEAEAVVVFEDLYDGEKLIAVHHDINDEAQTVYMVEIEVIKTDSETGKRLEGAEFTMYDKKGNVLDVQVTDKDGLAHFNIVEGEKVVIKETEAPEGYKINKKQSKHKITGEQEKITLEIENDKIPENPLPKTATDVFNYALIGLGLLVAGLTGFYFLRKRKVNSAE